MRTKPLGMCVAVVSAFALAIHPLCAQTKGFEVTLKREWVKKFADRTSMTAEMTVRHTHSSANPIGSGGDDGDMHFSGESPDVGLPFVAEIVNAAMVTQKAAVSEMKVRQKSAEVLPVAGAWRLWFEHPAATQTQGGDNAFHPDHTNPDHSFEIHPVSRVDHNDVGGSFVPIPKYKAYSADVAFPYFDKCTLTIKASSSGISLRSKKLKYNYVDFEIELTQPPKKVADGFIALARVLATGDEEAADGPRRMIFVAGTKAAASIQKALAGDRLHVLGIPRINLNAVLFLVDKNGTKQFDAQMPYEMIIAGVF